MKHFLFIVICISFATLSTAQTKVKKSATKTKVTSTAQKSTTGELSVPQSQKPKVNPNIPKLGLKTQYDEISVNGKVVNCLGEELSAVQVVLYDENILKVLATTLTDITGRYNFTAKGYAVYAIQIVFGKDSSQIVKVPVQDADGGINLEFMARNLPQEYLFPAVSPLGNNMLNEKQKADRNVLKKQMNGDKNLDVSVPNVKSVAMQNPLRIGSTNVIGGIMYETRSSTFSDSEVDADVKRDEIAPSMPPMNPALPGGGR
jgi:hypothetical protein